MIKYVDPIARDIDWVLLDIIVKCMTTSTSTPSKKSPASSPIVVSKLYVKLGHIVVDSGGKLSLTNAGDEVIPFTLALDENGSYDIDLFRFFCLQHYFDKAPAMLSQISERSKMYSRTKARLEIKAGDALYSSEDLNEYIASLKILKSPNVSSSSSSSSSSQPQRYHKELLISFAYTKGMSNTITKEYLQHLIKTLRISSNELRGRLYDYHKESDDDDDNDDDVDYEDVPPRIFSQNPDQEEPGKLADKKQDAKNTRDAVPFAKSLLRNLQMNSDESNPFYQAISDKIESAMVKWLTQQPEGKIALHQVGEGEMLSMTKFSVGPVELPVNFMPAHDHIYWKATLGSAPFDITRSRYPSQSSGKLASHSSTTPSSGLERGLADCFMLLVESRGGGEATQKSRALQVGNLYFRRDPKVKIAVSSSGKPHESIIDVLKKLKQADPQSYGLLLEKPDFTRKLAFEVSLTNETCIRYSIERAGTITLQSLIEDPNIAVPVCVSIVVTDDVAVTEAEIFDLFSP